MSLSIEEAAGTAKAAEGGGGIESSALHGRQRSRTIGPLVRVRRGFVWR